MIVLLLLFGESQLGLPFLWLSGNNIICVALLCYNKLLLIVFEVVNKLFVEECLLFVSEILKVK